MISDLSKLTGLIEKDENLRKVIRCHNLVELSFSEKKYPITAFSIGSQNPRAPVLFMTGGLHGLERIGAQLAWSLLKSTVDRLTWDKSLQHLFQHIRLSVIPLVNPVGYFHHTRSNGNGVDLMRNSPIQAKESAPFLLGGQSFSKKLPWYQGEGVLEPENKALVSFFQSEASQSECVISLDFHSGFGMKDRIWFPFSYTKEPFDHLTEMFALTYLFEQIHPYHIYQIEPQSSGYLLNGDIWDYLYLDFRLKNSSSVFLPLTLEMGSWSWVKKNPAQIFSRHGAFNPMKEHRLRRTYRRHHLLFDFLLRSLHSHEVWTNSDALQKTRYENKAKERWYVP